MLENPEEIFSLNLAKESVLYYLTYNAYFPLPQEIPENFLKKAGVFVTLMSREKLRGCIGTIIPQTDSIAQEILANAVAAATRDPRFPPVSLEEIAGLSFSVDVLGVAEPVNLLEQLDPAIYGVIVTSGVKVGLLLPGLEGVDTPQMQVEIACQKAGIEKEEKIHLARFQVKRYGKK